MQIPDFLYKNIVNDYGEELTKKIIDRYNLKRVVSLRVNTLKTNIDYIKEVLDKNNIEYKEVDNIPFALVVSKDESVIQELDIYKEGLIYLQSISSMLPPLYLDLVVSIKFNANVRDSIACVFNASIGQSLYISPATTPSI